MKMIRHLSALFAFLLAGSAFAALTPNTFVAVQTPTNGLVQFLQGTDSAGTYKTVYSAGANGSKCWGSLLLSTNDATAHVMSLAIIRSAVTYVLATLTTGTTTPGFAAGVPALNMMAATNWPLGLDSDGNPAVILKSGDTLSITFATALTSTDVINVLVPTCGDF